MIAHNPGPKAGVGERGAAGTISKLMYNNIIKSVPVYGTTILGLAICGDLVFDSVSDGVWNAVNRYDDLMTRSWRLLLVCGSSPRVTHTPPLEFATHPAALPSPGRACCDWL